MIYDVIRRISREHTLVVSERGRDDATLPTDLWKKPVSKYLVNNNHLYRGNFFHKRYGFQKGPQD